ECLALQGFTHTFQKQADNSGFGEEFGQDELMDLAGNAFCGAVLFAVWLVIVAAAPLAEADEIGVASREEQ
ncbi:unnamed protein product, partial [Prorocentrum cordatum]